MKQFVFPIILLLIGSCCDGSRRESVKNGEAKSIELQIMDVEPPIFIKIQVNSKLVSTSPVSISLEANTPVKLGLSLICRKIFSKHIQEIQKKYQIKEYIDDYQKILRLLRDKPKNYGVKLKNIYKKFSKYSKSTGAFGFSRELENVQNYFLSRQMVHLYEDATLPLPLQKAVKKWEKLQTLNSSLEALYQCGYISSDFEKIVQKKIASFDVNKTAWHGNNLYFVSLALMMIRSELEQRWINKRKLLTGSRKYLNLIAELIEKEIFGDTTLEILICSELAVLENLGWNSSKFPEELSLKIALKIPTGSSYKLKEYYFQLALPLPKDSKPNVINLGQLLYFKGKVYFSK